MMERMDSGTGKLAAKCEANETGSIWTHTK